MLSGHLSDSGIAKLVKMAEKAVVSSYDQFEPLLWVQVKLGSRLIYIQLTASERARYLAESEDKQGELFFGIMHFCIAFILENAPKEDGSPHEIFRSDLALLQEQFKGEAKYDLPHALVDAFRSKKLTTEYMEALRVLDDENDELYQLFGEMQISDDTGNILTTESILSDVANETSDIFMN